MNIPRIGITIGDPYGVGPEVVFKAIAEYGFADFIPVVYGDISVTEELKSCMTVPQLSVIRSPMEAINPGNIYFVQTGSFYFNPKQIGQNDPEAGQASFQWIRQAIDAAKSHVLSAVVTAPISKKSWQLAGIIFPGHTELFAHETETRDYAMGFYSEKLSVVLATIHEPLALVPKLITTELVLSKIKLARTFWHKILKREPRIAVAGINPHAGELGLFGHEEVQIILPAIKLAQQSGADVTGPWPADTLFHQAYNGIYDLVIAMYHDQGLVPLKTVAFDSAVNVTLGLPFIRTSPDHGTAFDIAYQGKASARSMGEAIKLAVKYCG